jgi:hypothetical protein
MWIRKERCVIRCGFNVNIEGRKWVTKEHHEGDGLIVVDIVEDSVSKWIIKEWE